MMRKKFFAEKVKLRLAERRFKFKITFPTLLLRNGKVDSTVRRIVVGNSSVGNILAKNPAILKIWKRSIVHEIQSFILDVLVVLLQLSIEGAVVILFLRVPIPVERFSLAVILARLSVI